jgi:microcystin-dependent protein
MTNVYLGQITGFGGNFAPRMYAFCNGQTLAIAQNTALFSLLGTYYGGNGQTTFQLPNLQSRLPVHMGQGTGLSPYAIGQNGGAPNVTITTQTMPSHNHMLVATSNNATTNTIGNGVLPGQPTAGSPPFFYTVPINGQPAPIPEQLAAGVCGLTGGNQPHANLMPSLCITFLIALQGIYPSRN